MSKFENLEQVAEALKEILGDDHTINTVEQLVDGLADLGNNPKVLVRHDDYIGLKGSLPDEFLKTPLEDIDEEKFEPESEAVLDQANIIFPLYRRDLSDDDIEEIREDRQYRGEDIDD